MLELMFFVAEIAMCDRQMLNMKLPPEQDAVK